MQLLLPHRNLSFLLDHESDDDGGEAKGEAMTPARRKKVVEVEELELLTDAEV